MWVSFYSPSYSQLSNYGMLRVETNDLALNNFEQKIDACRERTRCS
jgi:hypothetical protein